MKMKFKILKLESILQGLNIFQFYLVFSGCAKMTITLNVKNKDDKQWYFIISSNKQERKFPGREVSHKPNLLNLK